MADLKKKDVIEMNKHICEHSGDPHKIRDEGTLDHAMNKGRSIDRSIAIAKNHPFVEGNKRTAIAVGVYMNLWEFNDYPSVKPPTIKTFIRDMTERPPLGLWPTVFKILGEV